MQINKNNPQLLVGMHQEERFLISLSHDVRPGPLFHQDSQNYQKLSPPTTSLHPWQHFTGTPAWENIFIVKTVQPERQPLWQAWEA